MICFDFGKYRGWRVDKVPTCYLDWCFTEDRFNVFVQAAAWVELCARGETRPMPSFVSWCVSAAQIGSAQSPPELAQSPQLGCVALEIIDAGRRSLALRYHPDRGGDLEKMCEVNMQADALLALATSSLSRSVA